MIGWDSGWHGQPQLGTSLGKLRFFVAPAVNSDAAVFISFEEDVCLSLQVSSIYGSLSAPCYMPASCCISCAWK